MNDAAESTSAFDGQVEKEFRYRKDIDGLRAIAVAAVIVFHLGFAATGFLGVDVFFVISGYLITGIVLDDIARGRFTVADFYRRRVRRILPLSLITSLVALLLGTLVMLPDDLENLAQSVVATNLFSNNILQAITTRNYWDIVNEYKPLMHTWSLGVEEQFYLFWPLILIFASRFIRDWLGWVLALFCACSLIIYLLPVADYVRFYHLPFRLFELGAGGLVAVGHSRGMPRFAWGQVGLPGLMTLLAFGHWLPRESLIPLAVVCTCMLMMTASDRPSWYTNLLENRLLVYLGMISFSLYMWHQIVFAYARYAVVEVIDASWALALVALTLVLSVLSFHYVERLFRDKHRVSFARVGVLTGSLFVFGTTGALWVYAQGGVVRDVPEMDLVAGEGRRGIHANFNHKINGFNHDFATDRIRVLVVGNSFARDWANVLLATHWKDLIEVSYVPDLLGNQDALMRGEKADVIFWSEASQELVSKLDSRLRGKVYVIGTKNFGRSAGIFYNFRGDGYFEQRVRPDMAWIQMNAELATAHGARYLDQMSPLMDENGAVPVFTDEGKFISQDCRHLTSAGAVFMAKVMTPRINAILARYVPTNGRKPEDGV